MLAAWSTIFCIYLLADGILVASIIPLAVWLLTKAMLGSRIICRTTVFRVVIVPELTLNVSLNT